MKFSKDEFVERYKAKYGEEPKPYMISITELVLNAYNEGFEDGLQKSKCKCLAKAGNT